MTVGELKELLDKVPNECEIELAIARSGVCAFNRDEIKVAISKWAITPYVIIGEATSIHMSGGGFEDFTFISKE